MLKLALLNTVLLVVLALLPERRARRPGEPSGEKSPGEARRAGLFVPWSSGMGRLPTLAVITVAGFLVGAVTAQLRSSADGRTSPNAGEPARTRATAGERFAGESCPAAPGTQVAPQIPASPQIPEITPTRSTVPWLAQVSDSEHPIPIPNASPAGTAQGRSL